MVLACSGHLRFAAATSHAIKNLIEYWSGESPGFYDGDQIFFNDPYVAGSHTYDMMVVKPIFHDGRAHRLDRHQHPHRRHRRRAPGRARSRSSTRASASCGLKVVENGASSGRTSSAPSPSMCRDPQYVGLDIKAMIAGNNVCAEPLPEPGGQVRSWSSSRPPDKRAHGRRFRGQGPRQAALAARRRTWRFSRVRHHSCDREARPGRWPTASPSICAVTKKGDALDIDLDGTSPQTDARPPTPPSRAPRPTSPSRSPTQLFWDIPWNDGKLAPIRMTVPEGSVLNCTFPAACGLAPMIGGMFVAAVSECLAKMLYTAGRKEDVNAGWAGAWYSGGPGFMYGGHNREGPGQRPGTLRRARRRPRRPAGPRRRGYRRPHEHPLRRHLATSSASRCNTRSSTSPAGT